MQNRLEERHKNTGQMIASWIYLFSLYLYPKRFRARFGQEMGEVFQQAFAEHAQNGIISLLGFLSRELIEAPLSILSQHISGKSFRERPYFVNIFAFTIGCIPFGIIEGLKIYLGFDGGVAYWVALLSYAFAGGIGGLAVGSILNPQRKIRFALSGALGFLLANTLLRKIFDGFFPDAFLAPGSGIGFWVPFLFPILGGSLFGLFIGAANRKWADLFRFVSWGSLALLAGFFVNRLSSALMQSYWFNSSIPGIAQTDFVALFVYLLLPYLLEGLLLGTLFGRAAQRSMALAV